MAVPTFTKTGTKATTPAKLDKRVFALEVSNHNLLKEAYVAYLSNGRQASATTLKRGEVSGGGKKPWRQKGTGRARVGSSRTPVWRGGGIVFGPSGEENYAKQLNTKAKRQAIRQALSLAASGNKVIVIDELAVKDGKTAELAKLLKKIGAERRVLVSVENKTEELVRASRNMPDVKVTQAMYVNAYDILNADAIVMTAAALKQITEWLTSETRKEVKA